MASSSAAAGGSRRQQAETGAGTVRIRWSRTRPAETGNRGRDADEEGPGGVDFFAAVCRERAGGSRGRGYPL